MEFLKTLSQMVGRKLLIVWDRLQAHRSRLLRNYVEQQNGRIALEYLPAYAPELNPVGAHLGLSEIPRHAQLLRQGSRPAQACRPIQAALHAVEQPSSPRSGDRLSCSEWSPIYASLNSTRMPCVWDVSSLRSLALGVDAAVHRESRETPCRLGPATVGTSTGYLAHAPGTRRATDQYDAIGWIARHATSAR